jgi:hypothetical protein
MAKRIPAGGQFLFQVHYTPNGSEQFDHSKLGLIFADPKTITHEVKTVSAAGKSLAIPPGDNNYRIEAATTIREDDLLVLNLMPHMHLRGKSFFYEAIFADGRKETLLDVPRYDFNWQTAYRLADPKALPQGTKVHCVAHFDNSAENLNNPDPTKTVRWGDQTWDEMMIGYFDVAVPIGQANEEEKESQKTAETKSQQRLKEIVKRFDADEDGVLQKAEIPEKMQKIFDRLDSDKSGALNEQELKALLSFLPN